MLSVDFTHVSALPADSLERGSLWFRLAARVARLTAPIQ
jgi:hypothetical protein